MHRWLEQSCRVYWTLHRLCGNSGLDVIVVKKKDQFLQQSNKKGLLNTKYLMKILLFINQNLQTYCISYTKTSTTFSNVELFQIFHTLSCYMVLNDELKIKKVKAHNHLLSYFKQGKGSLRGCIQKNIRMNGPASV